MTYILPLLFLASCATPFKVTREDSLEVRHIKVQSREDGVNLFELASLYSFEDCSKFPDHSAQMIYSRAEGKGHRMGYICNLSGDAEYRAMKELETVYCQRNKSELMAGYCEGLIGRKLARR